MSEQPLSGPLGQFLGDLSAIREKRNISLEALRDATKVYPNIIVQFEQDGLADHPLFNSLYIRAFIRSYAKTLGIPAEDILLAYDKALAGDYNRQLAIEYLDLPADEIERIKASIPKPEEKEEPVFSVDKFEFEKRQGEKPAKSKHEREDRRIEEAAASGAAVTFIPRADPRENSVETMASGIRATLQSLFEKGKQSPIFQWSLLAGGIGLGLFVILQLLSFQSNPPAEDAPLEAMNAAPVDTMTAATLLDSIELVPVETPAVQQTSVPVALGDSIPFYVVAEAGRLDPFRVKRDRDLRRPYWLDEGDSMLFHFVDRAVIEDNLDAMKILIEGYSYPIYETDSLAQVIIDRDSLQAFLATR